MDSTRSTTVVDTINTETVDAINAEHEATTLAAGQALRHAMRCGDLLLQAKTACRHGEWQGWLGHHFRGSARTARAYMRLAEHRDELESKTAGHAVLSISTAMRLLSRPKPAKQCVLCGQAFTEWGNNPWPLATYDDGKCCDGCNASEVIPARLVDLKIARAAVASQHPAAEIPRSKPGFVVVGHADQAIVQIVPSAKLPGYIYAAGVNLAPGPGSDAVMITTGNRAMLDSPLVLGMLLDDVGAPGQFEWLQVPFAEQGRMLPFEKLAEAMEGAA